MNFGMLSPQLSLSDPLTELEGSRDPLGLANLATQLADRILPGMTARMWRPRFLTAMSVAAVVTEKFRDRSAADGSTPAYLVFEWFALEAFARADTQNNGNLKNIPGIEKTRTARNEGAFLSPTRYLKTPTVLGFHGVYKTLARDLEIVDDELCLLPNGYRLVRAWERAEGMTGFADGQDGAGKSLREHLQRIVREGLGAGHTIENRRWRFFLDSLRPDRPRKSERQLIWSFLTSGDSSRRQIFHILSKPVAMRRQQNLAEADFLGWLDSRVSEELRLHLKAITAYERLSRTLHDAFDWIRYLSTKTRLRPITSKDFSEKSASLLRRVSADINKASLALERINLDSDFSDLMTAFGTVSDAGAFFERLIRRHEYVQRNKPPGNKRPWFERATNGVVVRDPYRLYEPPTGEMAYVHGYRIPNVANFIKDLQGGL